MIKNFINAIDINKDINEVILSADKCRIKLEIIDQCVIRVVYTLRDTFIDKPSLMMLPRIPGDVKWTVEENVSEVMISTQYLHLKINRSSGAFTWLDSAGLVLVKEPAQGGKTLEEIPVDENRKFIIDLSGVGFLSSLVIATVVFFAKKVKENNGELKLSGLSSEAYSVLQITQLDKVFDLHDTEDDAVQSFK